MGRSPMTTFEAAMWQCDYCEQRVQTAFNARRAAPHRPSNPCPGQGCGESEWTLVQRSDE